MVNYLKDFCLFYVVNGLSPLVVVNKNELLFPYIDEVSSGNRTKTSSVCIYYREVTIAVLTHSFLDCICKIIRVEGYYALTFHKVSYRYAMAYKSCYGIGIHRTFYDYAALLLRCRYDVFICCVSATYHYTAGICLDGRKLGIFSIAKHNQVICCHIGRKKLRVISANDNPSLYEVAMFIAKSKPSI